MKNKQGKWLFIVGLVALFIGVAACIAAIVFEFLSRSDLVRIMAIVIGVSGPVALALLIVKFLVYGGAEQEKPATPKVNTYKYNEKDIPIVDVKEFKKSQDEIMYDKYVDLYNKKIITKEDLEKKRIELLGK